MRLSSLNFTLLDLIRFWLWGKNFSSLRYCSIIICNKRMKIMTFIRFFFLLDVLAYFIRCAYILLFYFYYHENQMCNLNEKFWTFSADLSKKQESIEFLGVIVLSPSKIISASQTRQQFFKNVTHKIYFYPTWKVLLSLLTQRKLSENNKRWRRWDLHTILFHSLLISWWLINRRSTCMMWN